MKTLRKTALLVLVGLFLIVVFNYSIESKTSANHKHYYKGVEYADILEVGSPLIYAHGLHAVEQFKKTFPGKCKIKRIARCQYSPL